MLGQYYEFDLPMHPEWEQQDPVAALVGLAVFLVMMISSLVFIWRGDKRRAADREREWARDNRPRRSRSA